MKVVLLAGGLGTRISEESVTKPKPMVEIGGMPIIWHIMKEYCYYGFHEFIICAGYKQHMIKNWVANYYLNSCDVTFDFKENNKITFHNGEVEPWKVTVVDTGYATMTGGRIKRIKKYVEDEPFMMTYGDGVCDIDLAKLSEFHKSHGKIATLTSVELEQRFGLLDVQNDTVRAFREKSQTDSGRINAGYMVLQPEIFDFIQDDATVFERDTLPSLAAIGQLKTYSHNGFWQCMDTKNEMDKLERIWQSGAAPWKKW